VFFSNGNFSVPSQWWILPVIAIPLTILVFGVWLFWKRRRNIIGSKEMEGLKIDDLEEGAPDFTGQSLTATSIPALYNADSKV